MLEIDSFLPVEFQQALRGEFPMLAVELDEGTGGRHPEPSSKTFEFSSPQHNAKVMLDATAMRLSSDACSGVFGSPLLGKAMDALLGSYGIPFFERVGVRREDLFVRSELGLGSEPWGRLINPTLLGVMVDHQVKEEDVLGQTTTVVLATGAGRLCFTHGLVRSVDTSEAAYYMETDYSMDGHVAADKPGTLKLIHQLSSEANQFHGRYISEQLFRAVEQAAR